MYKIFLIIILSVISFSTSAANISYKVYKGHEIKNFLKEIKSLRLNIYVEYPYLYLSDDEDKEDTSYYENSPSTILIVAQDNKKIAGLVIGLPLKDYTFDNNKIAYQQMSDKLGKEFENYYYISEILIQKKYWNSGIDAKMIAMLEDQVKKLDNKYDSLSALIVEREQENFSKPKKYYSEESLLKSLQYGPTEHYVTMGWKVIRIDNLAIEDENIMRLWTKKLSIAN